jgi:hypothetical protein
MQTKRLNNPEKEVVAFGGGRPPEAETHVVSRCSGRKCGFSSR